MDRIKERIINFPYEAGIALRYPKIIPVFETLDILKEQKKSITRFGDGEFNLIFGKHCYFEEPNAELTNDLLKILHLIDENVMIGIPDIFRSLKDFLPTSKKYWRKYLTQNRARIYETLDLNKTYCDALVTRPYAKSIRSLAESGRIFEKWKQVWRERKVVLVTGDSRYLPGSSGLFDDASQLEVVFSEPSYAYRLRQEILTNIHSFEKDHIILLVLGPTATVLVPILSKEGYQALDIGHLESEYITFLNESKGQLINTIRE